MNILKYIRLKLLLFKIVSALKTVICSFKCKQHEEFYMVCSCLKTRTYELLMFEILKI